MKIRGQPSNSVNIGPIVKAEAKVA